MFVAFIPSILATTALALSAISNLWCETIVFKPEIGNGDNIVFPDRSFGPFYRKEIVLIQISGGGDAYTVAPACVAYPSGFGTDSEWKTTQAFAIITVVIGAIMVFWSWLSPCLQFGTKFWKQAGCVFMFCSITQGLTLLFLQSSACNDNAIVQGLVEGTYSETCEWDFGTKTNISAVVFWAVAGAAMCVVKPPEQEDRPPAETQTVTYAETPNADGTTTMTETNVVKGTYVAGEGVDKEEQAAEEP